MKTVAFCKDKSDRVNIAICAAFGCATGDLTCFSDTIFKKVAVFVLHRLFDFEKRGIAKRYNMTHWYVPTVVEEIEFKIMVVPGFRLKIIDVCNKIGYEANLELSGCKIVNSVLL